MYLQSLHLTNLRKSEGYFEIKKRNYNIQTPCDLATDVISQFETCSIEKEIAQKILNLFKKNEANYYDNINQKINNLNT